MIPDFYQDNHLQSVAMYAGTAVCWYCCVLLQYVLQECKKKIKQKARSVTDLAGHLQQNWYMQVTSKLTVNKQAGIPRHFFQPGHFLSALHCALMPHFLHTQLCYEHSEVVDK